MNQFKFTLIFVFFTSTILTLHAKEVDVSPVNVENATHGLDIANSNYPDTLLNENASSELAQLILGKWEIVPNNRVTGGLITFNQNGTYEMHEKLIDGTSVSKKGKYLLYSNETPVKIDICLGKCKQDGSEWTTLFGIIRVISTEKLEIHTSANGTYPSAFSEDKSDEGTMMLGRSK